MEHLATRTHEQMKDVLMNPDASGPAVHYYMIRSERGQQNITVWEPGTVGGEYIKTYGHYHVGDLHETYTVLQGEGTVLLQKLGEGENVEEFRVVPISVGDSVEMPAGWGHVIVNVGEGYLVTADTTNVNPTPEEAAAGHAEYDMVKKMRGFAYYVIEHNGVPMLKHNNLYKEIPIEELVYPVYN